MKLLQLVSLVDLQARTALKAEAAKTYLSYVWWVLEPLLYVAVFYLVFETLLSRGGPDFIFFLMCGKVPYLWISKTVTISQNSLLENKGLIAAISVPKVIFPYISIQQALYKQWPVFLVLFGTAFYFGSSPDWDWLWLVPIIITNYLMLLPIALLAALLVTYAQDFRILINMGLLFIMFASGIFWDIHDIPNQQLQDLLLTLNPMAYLIDEYRNVLMYDQPVDALHLASLAIVFLALTGVMHYIYEALQYNLTRQVLQS